MSSSTTTSARPRPDARWRAYLQLFRIPNVFTALADVTMGYVVTHDVPLPTLHLPAGFFLLLGSSACLYTAGMVLNDVYDYAQDLQQRPQRPLPSGRIQLRWARWLGYELLLVGAMLAAVAGALAGQMRSGLVGLALVLAILAYDRLLKSTALAPLAMGCCRLLNVLLGMSLAEVPWQPVHYGVAGAVALYITGVTWFARTEAVESRRSQLALGMAGIAAGVAALALVPHWPAAGMELPYLPVHAGDTRWYLLCTVVGLLILRRCAVALWQPTPARVQMAVKNCILSLIVLDAVAAFAFRGMPWAVAILVLLFPTMYLGRWIYST